MGNKLIAPCGLDCSKCDARIATVNNDDELRVRTAKLWNELSHFDFIKPEHINCMGCRCKEGPKTVFCSSMCEIRKCSQAAFSTFSSPKNSILSHFIATIPVFCIIFYRIFGL